MTFQPERLCPKCGIVIPSNVNHFCAAPVAVPTGPAHYGYYVEGQNKTICAECGKTFKDSTHLGDTPPAPLPPTQEPTQPKIGEDAWLELVARTNESLTPEQRQNITAVLEAVDTALNKDRDGVKALAARLLEQQRELAAAESRIAQLERKVKELENELEFKAN